jgi:hypothetical protein
VEKFFRFFQPAVPLLVSGLGRLDLLLQFLIYEKERKRRREQMLMMAA